MANPSSVTNEYDVSKYTDAELYSILNLDAAATDGELEAKLLSLIRKYSGYGNADGDRIAQFYTDMYTHFFDVPGMEAENPTPLAVSKRVEEVADSQALAVSQVAIQPKADSSSSNGSGNGSSSSNGNGNGALGKDEIKLTKPVDYAKDRLNPLLKQSIKRIISIDSQYRENKSSASTQFTFNLSEPLKDVVSLSLYSVQIPYTWYTINGNFGGNFIYIKGLSPGIDNGQHDYKIQIPSGNYTPDALVARVNAAIQTLPTLYPGVSFGRTAAVFNDGIPSSSGGTGKAKFLVDITDVYGEGNFFLQFPRWTSPAVFTEKTEDNVFVTRTNRFRSIAGYLGFNDPTHRTTGIYSNYLTGFSTGEGSTKDDEFTVTPQNASFDLVPYVGAHYLDAVAAGTTYVSDAVSLTLWDATYTASTSRTYTRGQLVALLDTALKSHPRLDPNFSGCTWVDISGQDADGFDQFNKGNSYLAIHCKLNKNTAPVVRNLKLVARFPAAAASVFTSDSSCFKIPTVAGLVDASQNVLYELNDVLADTSVLQTNYVIVGTNQLQFVCVDPAYASAANHFFVTLPPSVIGYTLQDYLAQTNAALAAVPEIRGTGTGTTTTTMYLGRTDNYVYLQAYVRKSFGSAFYTVRGTGEIAAMFDLPLTADPLQETNNVFSNSNYAFNGYAFGSGDRLIVEAVRNDPGRRGLELFGGFDISFNNGIAYNSVQQMELYLNTRITTWADTAGRRPFANAKVEYVAGAGFVLTLNVQVVLTQNDYRLTFYAADGNGTPLPVELNSWNTNLYFSNTTTSPATTNYGLADPLYQQNNGAYSLIRSNFTKNDNQIPLYDGSDNSFSLVPYGTVDGLQTATGAYTVRIDLAPGSYSVVSLLDAINAQLAANPLTVGSRFETVTLRGQLFVQMRWNINQVFSTKDYQLVFYDPISFVSCYSGASSSGSKSIQNATWDTTLGWILGFRNHISYNLGDFVDTRYAYDTTDLEYYLTGADSNVFVLNGDTAVNTNLYNYFLIVLDDYVQNHLNDGLVTVTGQDTVINHAPAVFVCDPATGQKIARPVDYGSPGVTYTEKQLYAFNQQVQSDAIKNRSYSKGPFVQDVFGIIPIKPGTINSVYTEFGGTLQNQQRMYFGPVNIHRMTIRLLNDRGDLVDLNNANWGFSLICEQLYRNT